MLTNREITFEEFPFSFENEKKGNGRSFFTIHFPISIENETNGMYSVSQKIPPPLRYLTFFYFFTNG